MEEDQSPELLELGYSEVRSLHRSKTFISVESNSNVSFIDH